MNETDVLDAPPTPEQAAELVKAACDKLTPNEMKQALAAEQQERVKQAAEGIRAVCETYKVQIVPKAELMQDTVTMSLQILPTE